MCDGTESSGPDQLQGVLGLAQKWPEDHRFMSDVWLPAVLLLLSEGQDLALCHWVTVSHKSCQTVHLCTSLTNLEQYRIFHSRPRLLKVIFCVPGTICYGLYLALVWLISRYSLWHRPYSFSLFRTLTASKLSPNHIRVYNSWVLIWGIKLLKKNRRFRRV